MLTSDKLGCQQSTVTNKLIDEGDKNTRRGGWILFLLFILLKSLIRSS